LFIWIGSVDQLDLVGPGLLEEVEASRFVHRLLHHHQRRVREHLAGGVFSNTLETKKRI
jgi:hypothetical protein